MEKYLVEINKIESNKNCKKFMNVFIVSCFRFM